jgi:hypothetical protein
MVTIIKKGSSARKIQIKLEKMTKGKRNKGIASLCGSIQMDTDPSELQKKWRNEWK